MATGANNGVDIARTQRALHVYLIDDVTGTSNGAWVDTLDYENGSIDVVIATTATVQIRGSDEPSRPAAATDGRQIGSDQTSSAILSIDRLPRWIKAKISAHAAGAVNVYAVFRKQSP